MTVGIPGSGKTTFASAFSRAFGTPLLDLSFIEQQSADGAAAGELTIMFLTELAKTEQTFVLEGSGATLGWRSEFAKWATAHGYVPLFVWTQVDQATAYKRAAKVHKMSRSQFADELQAFEPPQASEKPVVISGKHTFASQARMVLNHIASHSRPSVKSAPRRPAHVAVKPPSRNINIQ